MGKDERAKKAAQADLEAVDARHAELLENHARLSTAVRTLFRYAPPPTWAFDEGAVATAEVVAGNDEVAQMINFGIRVAGKSREEIAREAETTKGLLVAIMPVDTEFDVIDERGHLEAGEGYEGTLIGLIGTQRLQGNIPLVEGIATLTSGEGVTRPVQVGVLGNGAIFVTSYELGEAFAHQAA